jgi:hypothetical protein
MSFFAKIKFYIKNAIWNYKFWLLAKRKYVFYNYIIDNPIKQKKQKVSKKRFLGYEYKGNVYLDNPGKPIKNKEEWDIVKNKL